MIDKELYQKIEDALKQIRPYLEADGGDVTLVEVTEDYVAKVKLHGSCSTCSMSMMTMKAGVEETVKRAVKEIKSVEAIDLSVNA
ncbi:MAG: NifU family protein [Bacteroidia bacterium]|nr:NifU family protein [Bacteroidia bacterium]MCZ2248801.1 NifU family protein [Bacteroidia bacterium]